MQICKKIIIAVCDCQTWNLEDFSELIKKSAIMKVGRKAGISKLQVYHWVYLKLYQIPIQALDKVFVVVGLFSDYFPVKCFVLRCKLQNL